LGQTFCGQEHWPRKKSIQKLRDTIREKTPRTDGRILQCVIGEFGGWHHFLCLPRFGGWHLFPCGTRLSLRVNSS
jgi:hypothetical protein